MSSSVDDTVDTADAAGIADTPTPEIADIPDVDDSVTCFHCGENVDPESKMFEDRGKNQFCGSCWMHRIETQVRKRLVEVSGRTSLEDAKEPPEKVLLLCDGTNSSFALINICQEAKITNSLIENNPRGLPFPFKFSILVLADNMGPDLKLVTKTVISLAKCIGANEMDMRVFTSSLQYALSEEPLLHEIIGETTSKNGYKVNTLWGMDCNDSFSQILDDLKYETSKLDFQRILRNRLVGNVCERLGIKKVLLPDTQSSLGGKLFTLIALGRGGQIACEVALSAYWNNLIMCRVLIDFSDPELLDYLTALKLSDDFPEFQPKLSDLMIKVKPPNPFSPSLATQCFSFIGKLEQSHPHTVSTLTKIGGKLQQNSSTDACILCKGVIDEETKLKTCDNEWCHGCFRILKDMKSPQLLRDFANGRLPDPDTDEDE